MNCNYFYTFDTIEISILVIMSRNTFLYFSFFFLAIVVEASAQTLSEARKLYEEGKYAQAKPVFQRYVKQVPNNGNYNLWYGVCCLHTNNAQTAIDYLEKAVQKRVPSGQFWLGQAYDRVYRYEDAISTFEDYISELKHRRRSTQEADSLMALFRAHLRMLKGVERVCIIDSFVVDKAHFLEAYKLSPQTGHLYPYKEYFPMSEKEGSTVYENELGNKIYYGEIMPNGIQHIFTSTQLLEEWSPGLPLVGNWTDSVNIAYPFLMSDGLTLYYASEGKSSLGGYDIFVTRYNTNNDSFLRSENVGMPFNSPYNDYMYVIDEYNNLGWFASDRYQPDDRVCIYVFIPNPIKQVYNYEQMNKENLRSLAAIHSLKDTWSDPILVNEALTRLHKIDPMLDDKKRRHSFSFIIDDMHTYHEETDFHSLQALALFQQYIQIQKVLQQQYSKLEDLRISYNLASPEKRRQMASAILDIENRLSQLENKIKQIVKQVRNTEISVIKEK